MMANYGRGWDDGYGGQSAEAIDAHQEREAREQKARLEGRNRPMTKTPWTPGPWRTEPFARTRVSTFSGVGVAACGGARDSRRDREEEWREQVANARLIATAPELADLLQEALNDINAANTADWADRARAALAKARGEGEK